MDRCVRGLWAIAVVACAGCSSGGGGTQTLVDAAQAAFDQRAPAVDLAVDQASMPDLTMVPPDLVVILPGNGETGEPCAVDGDCSPSLGGPNPRGKCIKSTTANGMVIPWIGGYCQSPCRPSRGDPQTGLNNADCPSALAVCSPVSQTAGVCMAACQTAFDCRDNYVCGNVTGVATAACIPIAESTCDPPMDPVPQGKNCPNGQRCVSYSSDNSYGQCALVCDPIAQACPPPMVGTNGCIADLMSLDGSGICINVAQSLEGAGCFFLNDCASGLQCYQQVCRQYCRQIGNNPPTPACPQGETCQDMSINGINIQFDRSKTGICSP